MIHDENRALVQYWQALRAGRPCPMRAEVDPRNIPARIGNLFILEDLGRGNIRFRLAGSALVDAFWMELRGMPLHAIMALEARQSVKELVAETLAEPGVGHARLRHAANPDCRWEMVLLPLRSDTGRVDRALGGLQVIETAEKTGPADPPLTFLIEQMAISPVEFAAPGLGSTIGGFGEAGARFAGPDAAKRAAMAQASRAPVVSEAPRLTAIDGGGRQAVRRTGSGEKPFLRLVPKGD